MAFQSTEHRKLSCGIEMAALPMEGRRTATFELRMLTGMSDEPADKLGLAHLVEETIDKGTAKRTGQALTDAFDAIGAQRSCFSGREAFVFRCSCLPEYVDEAVGLHAELLRTPLFPEEACSVAVNLAKQSLTALDDEPDELARRMLVANAYGEPLGRHSLGTRESLSSIGRDDIVSYWRSNFSSGGMLAAVGGAIDAGRFSAALEKHFTGFGNEALTGRKKRAIRFNPGMWHLEKKAEQQYIMLCWPGVDVTDATEPVEEVMLHILGGGMSSRLFTEVREKQGLVYWVGAWAEHPRGSGMLFMGASTTPARCELTYQTLLREVDRIAEDVSEDELARAKIGITAKQETHGDLTASRVSELGADLFHYGRPVPHAEKTERILAVTLDQIRAYLARHPRDKLCVATVGTSELPGTTHREGRAD